MKVDLKYKIPIQGEYNASIIYCPECNYSPSPMASEIIGFADSPDGLMAVVECPVCFTKWYFHAGDLEHGSYSHFISFIKYDMQKHYKS